MERVAAVDIGSNTVKALLVERGSEGAVAVLDERSWASRLGEGIHAGRLREAAMRRTLGALEEVAGLCARHGVTRAACVGTSALRDAANRDEFIARAAELGLRVEAIDGTEEARLSYLAVRSDARWRHAAPLMVMDIGGGSTELIVGCAEGSIDARQSLRLGAVRLTEGHLRCDPPTISQLQEATAAVARTLSAFPAPGPGVRLVAVGGTATNMGAVELSAAGGSLADLHGLHLSAEAVAGQIRLYSGATVEQKRAIAGLDPARADVILGGAIIMSQVIALAGAVGVEISCRGLRWGLLFDRFGP
ncbi:MAG: Ppx/GppA family phosphatase [Armatimonadetes bacterium]|nr:Ppx/GppA family phosphatase [Armatimonadota bacterium]